MSNNVARSGLRRTASPLDGSFVDQLGGLRCRDEFYPARLLAFELLNLEALRLQVFERLAQQVIPTEAVSEGLGDLLDDPHHRVRAADVLGEQDAAAWSEHALRFSNRGRIIRDRAEPVGADDGVE
jgi:hypothetical protein